MNELFIFEVKKDFYKLYKDKTNELFYIYNRIYKMKKSDKEYGYNLFTQISNFINKDEITKIIKDIYKDKIIYTNNNHEHIINNLFLNEISIMKIKNSHIIIESNIDNPSFIKDLKSINKHLFICNFKKQDYYFLNNKKNLIKSWNTLDILVMII